MRGSISLLFSSLVLGSMAQTMQMSDAPQAGDHIRYAYLESEPVLAAGAGQSWNVSGPVEDVGNEVDFIPVAGAPGAAYFPQATIAAEQEGWAGAAGYFRVTSAGLEVLGSYEPGNIGVFIDTDRWLPYPCSYGTTWTDGYILVDGDSGDTTDQALPSLWTADGYGSLTGPAGTLQNVLKCHTVRSSIDVFAGDTATVTTVIDRFWKPGYPMYVAQVRHSTFEFPGDPPVTNTTVEVIDELAVGLRDASATDIGLDLFPNPAHGELNVVYTAEGVVAIRLLDALGREVRNADVAAAAPGIRRTAIDVQGLPSGRYLVRVIDASGRQVVRPFIVE